MPARLSRRCRSIATARSPGPCSKAAFSVLRKCPAPAERRARSLRRAVDGDDPPVVAHAGTLDMVDAGQRAILQRERQAMLRLEAEREPQSTADRAAMRDGDDVAAAMFLDEREDRAVDPRHHLDKALATGDALVRRRVPEAVE